MASPSPTACRNRVARREGAPRRVPTGTSSRVPSPPPTRRVRASPRDGFDAEEVLRARTRDRTRARAARAVLVSATRARRRPRRPPRRARRRTDRRRGRSPRRNLGGGVDALVSGGGEPAVVLSLRPGGETGGEPITRERRGASHHRRGGGGDGLRRRVVVSVVFGDDGRGDDGGVVGGTRRRRASFILRGGVVVVVVLLGAFTRAHRALPRLVEDRAWARARRGRVFSERSARVGVGLRARGVIASVARRVGEGFADPDADVGGVRVGVAAGDELAAGGRGAGGARGRRGVVPGEKSSEST